MTATNDTAASAGVGGTRGRGGAAGGGEEASVRCAAVINVDLVLDDTDGPVPNPFQCWKREHSRIELHEARVQWFCGEDDE